MGKLKCLLCGKEYETCNCPSDRKNRPWKVICCCPEHYQIRLVLNDYRYKNINKTAARKMLSRFDLTGYEDFKETYSSMITEILTVRKRKPKTDDNKKDIEVGKDLIE